MNPFADAITAPDLTRHPIELMCEGWGKVSVQIKTGPSAYEVRQHLRLSPYHHLRQGRRWVTP